jgi:hypothetical protein
MKKYFYFSLFVLLTSCINNLPEANISAVKVSNSRTEYNNQLALHFTSDVDLDSLRKNITATMKFRLYCPLDGSSDFDIERMGKKKYYIQGYLDTDINKTRKSNYSAKFFIYQCDTINDSFKRMQKEDIINLFKNKDCIPCKVYTTFYFTGRKPYFSKQFCIPAKDVLKALE